MFAHIFKTRIKCLLRVRDNLFWILCFPLIMASIFSVAFSNQSDLASKGFPAIEVAVIPHDNIPLEQMLNELARSEEPILRITYASEEEAITMLENETVEGVIKYSDANAELIVKSEGTVQTMLKSILDNFTQMDGAIKSLAENNAILYSDYFAKETSYIDETLLRTEKVYTSLYSFHAVMAMACLFGGFFSIKCISETQPNQSAKGMRRSMAPTHKLRIFLYEFLAVILVHITLMLLVLAFMILILDIDFGAKIPALILAVAVSSLLGLSLGVLLSALVPKGDKATCGIFNVIVIFSCFLAGIRGWGMKATTEANVPLLKYINPATLMSESYYSLYIYDSYQRFAFIIMIMLSMAFISILGACFIVRRQTYASI